MIFKWTGTLRAYYTYQLQKVVGMSHTHDADKSKGSQLGVSMPIGLMTALVSFSCSPG